MYKFPTLLLLLSLQILPSHVFSQSPVAPYSQANAAYEYVEVRAVPYLLKKNYTVQLTTAQDGSGSALTDAGGKKLEFSTPTAVLNYMGKAGWEFVAYIPDEDGKIGIKHFLMRRNLPTP